MTTETYRTPKLSIPFLIGLLSVVFLGVGCAGPQGGAVTDTPFLVSEDTGDRLDLAEEQMGLEEDASHAIQGDVSFGEAARVSCGPAASGPHPAFQVVVSDGDHQLTVLVPHHTPGGHDGSQEVQATLGRVGSDGGYAQSEGRGTASLHSASHQAGAFAVSGSFDVELSGEAGGGRVSGTFEECYYFT